MPNKKNELESLIKQNIKNTNLLIKKVEKFEKDFKRFEIMNLLRFLIVAIPIILAILYLIPIFRDFLEIYDPLIEALNRFSPL